MKFLNNNLETITQTDAKNIVLKINDTDTFIDYHGTELEQLKALGAKRVTLYSVQTKQGLVTQSLMHNPATKARVLKLNNALKVA